MNAMLRRWGFWLAAVAVWELVLRLAAHPELDHPWTVLAACCVVSGVLALLTELPGWAGRVCGWMFPPLCCALYMVQLVYRYIFGSLLSLSFVSMGGEAIATFRDIVLSAIGSCLPWLLLLAAPLVVCAVLRRRDWFPAMGWKQRAGTGAVCALLWAALAVTAGAQPAHVSVDHWADRYGLLAAQALDLRQMVAGTASALTFTNGPGSGENLKSEYWNVMEELDFEVLSDAARGDRELEELTAFLSSRSATAKHEYTGLFEGYNLIVVCAESFSPYLIDPEMTPTLYRLANGGIVFENFYGCFPNLTTNGEYSLCMGLLPDVTRMSFSWSSHHYLPFTIANLGAQEGMSAWAYHSNYGTYYDRDKTHPNMGYEFRAPGFGLDMEVGEPSSDLEMMEKSVDDYLDQEPFHAYYMTYSGHTPYKFDQNDMAQKNEALVAGLDGSEAYRAYYACQLELEAAMTYLVERLEQAGVAQRTVIVLTGDHLPYGLPDEDYAYLAGEAAEEPFWEYRSSFICWTPGLEEEPIVVDDYCCTIDILPTLANLFGFSYDSRLLAGRDVLAPGEHVAVLKDGSFLADGVYYDGVTGQFAWEGEPDEARGTALLSEVSNQFALSSAMLGTDYFRFAFSTLELMDAQEQEPDPDVPSFGDIAGTWYEDYVEQLVDIGAVQGSGFGSYNGGQAILRGEMVAMLTRSLQIPAANVELPYSDLMEGNWYLDALSGAYAAGLLPEEELFRPTDAVQVEEIRTLLRAAAAYAGLEEAQAWADGHLEQALERQAQDSACTAPEQTLSRGAAAFLMVELTQAAQESQPVQPEPDGAAAAP